MQRICAVVALLAVAAFTLTGFQQENDDHGRHVRRNIPSFGYIPIVANVVDTGSSSNPGGNKVLWSFAMKAALPAQSTTFLAVSMVDPTQVIPQSPIDLGTTKLSAADAIKRILNPRYPIDSVPVPGAVVNLDYTYSQVGTLPTGSFILVACTVDQATSGPNTGHWFAWLYSATRTLK